MRFPGNWATPSISHICVLLATSACAVGRGATTLEVANHTEPVRFANVQWSVPYAGTEGYPKGAQRATVSVDPRTGGETYYARFPAGSRFEPHWHAHNEYAVVLQGKVVHTLGNQSYALVPGDYVVIPAKTNHGWAVDSSGDVFLLIRRDGPADFNFVARE